MASSKSNYSSTVTIAETGPSGPGLQPRTVTLVGPGLPFMGAEWGFENQVITTWYPGNAIEATQQNLGPRELPSTWEGEWRRTMLGKSPVSYDDESGKRQQLVSPHVIRDVVEDIGRSGIRLRVTWSVIGVTTAGGGFGASPTNVNVSIVREGLMKSFSTPIDRHTDIRWKMEFHWASRGGRQDRVAAAQRDSDLSKVSDALEQSVNATLFFANTKIVSTKKDVRKSASKFTLGQLEAIAGAPSAALTGFLRQLQANVSQFKRAGDVAAKIGGTPEELAQSVRDFARNTTSVANAFADEMGRRPPELITRKAAPAAMLRATSYFAATTRAAALNARQGQALDNLVRRTVVAGGNRGEVASRDSSVSRAGDIVAVHMTRAGDTPVTLSSRYYGNADRGSDILRANRMPLYTPFFDPGTPLVIPSLGLGRDAT